MQKRSWILLLAVAGLILLGLNGSALADWPWNWIGGDHHHWGGRHAPELDPGMIGSGIALLVGAGLLIVDRYRRRR